MPYTYYNVTGNPVTISHGASSLIRAEFTLIETGMNAIDVAVALKGAITGQTWTGTHTFPATTYGVTATLGDSSTLLATTAFVAGTAFSSALPAQSGNNGEIITTDGVEASWTSIKTINSTSLLGSGNILLNGYGGTAITGNTTLTYSSNSSMTVTPTAYGLYATLPDATTCTKGSNLFSIYNAGDYDYGIKDSTGTKLGWIRARTGAIIGLSDNSTSAGNWTLYGVEKIGITSQYINTTITNMATGTKKITVDSNRTFFVFGGTDCYGIVYDASTQTWGSPTLIRATISSAAYVAVLSSTNQILVCTCDTTTAFEAVTLTLSGTGITVNSGTKATAVLAGNYAAFGQLIAVSTSWVVSYGRTTASAIRAITISGTTPTIGSESAVVTTVTTAPNIYASGSIVRAFSVSAILLTGTPYTVTGSALAAGTSATATTTAAVIRSFLNGNGNIVVEYTNTTHYASIFKLTGTVEAISSVSLGTASTNITAYNDCGIITASKTLFTSIVVGNTWYANILTDTSGTASAGTEISGTIANTLGSGLIVTQISGNTARLYSYNGTHYFITLDCSGTSPTFTSSIQQTGASGQFNQPIASDKYNDRSILLLTSGNTSIIVSDIGYSGSSTIGKSLMFTPSSIKLIDSVPILARFSSTNGVIGASNSETYASTVLLSNTGIFIQKMEMAA